MHFFLDLRFSTKAFVIITLIASVTANLWQKNSSHDDCVSTYFGNYGYNGCNKETFNPLTRAEDQDVLGYSTNNKSGSNQCIQNIPVLINNTEGWILSPNFGWGLYPSNMACIWDITVNSDNIVSYWMDWISLIFPDRVEVYYPDSRQKSFFALYTRNRPGSKKFSISNKIRMAFLSDQAIEDFGFKFRFQGIPAVVPVASDQIGPCSNEGATYVWIDEADYKIYSPNYVGDIMPRVDHNTFCQWKIEAPQGKILQIEFDMLWIISDPFSCGYDYLDIRDGTLNYPTDETIIYGCGIDVTSTGPVVLNFSTRQMLVTLLTDNIDESVGFAFNVRALEDPNPEIKCGGNVNGNGTVESPGYPELYPNNARCVWEIAVPSNMVVELRINQIQIQENSICSNGDELIITDSTTSVQLGSFCGHYNNEMIFLSHGSKMKVEFNTDSSIRFRGFSATFQGINIRDQLCTEEGKSIELTHGIITPHPTENVFQKECLTYTWTVTSEDYFLSVYMLPSVMPKCDEGRVIIGGREKELAPLCDRIFQEIILLDIVSGPVMIKVVTNNSQTTLPTFSVLLLPGSEQISSLSCTPDVSEYSMASLNISQSFRLNFPQSSSLPCTFYLQSAAGQFVELIITHVALTSVSCDDGNITIGDGSTQDIFPPICHLLFGGTGLLYTASTDKGLFLMFNPANTYLKIQGSFKSTDKAGIPANHYPYCVNASQTTTLKIKDNFSYNISNSEFGICKDWLIDNSKKGAVIKFNRLVVEEILGTCLYNSIQFYFVNDSGAKSLLNTYCGNKDGFKYTLPVGKLYIIVYSPVSSSTASLDASIIEGSEEANTCNDTLVFNEEGLYSLKPYPPNSNCSYLFTAPSDRLIEVNVTSVNIESSKYCKNDYLKFFTNGGTGVRPIRTICGISDAITVLSLTNEMSALFISDSTVEGEGFDLHVRHRKADSVPWLSCGLPMVQPRIVGGKPALPLSIPWQVALVIRGSLTPFCGGTLINRHTIITAAHCVLNFQRSPESIEVLGGLRDVSDFNHVNSIHYLSPAEIIVHPDYQDRIFRYDIAIIKLNDSVAISNDLSPACLPSQPVAVGTNCLVSGWGDIEYLGVASPVLLITEVIISAPDQCRENHPSTLCAHHPNNQGPCNGDSGGPLFCKKDDSSSWELYGVVSNGINCQSSGVNSAYAHIYNILQEPWLQNNIAV